MGLEAINSPTEPSIRDKTRGFWIPFAGVILTLIAGIFATAQPLRFLVDRPVKDDSTANLKIEEVLAIDRSNYERKVLMHRLRRDVLQTAIQGAAYLFSIALSLFFLKRYPKFAWANLWMTILFNTRWIMPGILILFQVDGSVFSDDLIGSPWKTLDEYRNDKWVSTYPLYGSVAIAIALGAFTRKLPWLKKQ